MEEKPPEAIGRGPTASRYQECAAHPFLLPCSLQEVLLLLATCIMRNSTTRFIVGISCHSVIPTPTAGFNKAALVSSMTFTPTHARPSIVNHFTAATVTTAVPLLVLLQHLQTLQMILPCILLFLVPSSSSAISLPQLLLSAAATRLLIVIILPLGNSTTLGTAVQRLPAHQIFNITITLTTTTTSNIRQFMAIGIYGTCLSLPAEDHRVKLVPLLPLIPHYFTNKHLPHSSNLLLLLLAHLLSSWILKPAFYHRYWTTCTTKLQLLLWPSSIFSLKWVFTLLAHKYAFFHVYFLHVYCLHATLKIHDNIYQLQLTVLLLPQFAACADSYSAPSSISDGALAMLGQPSYNMWKQATTTPSHASPPMPSQPGSLILGLLSLCLT